MKYKKVSAIIRTHKLGEVEARLKTIGVRGMTASYVLGFGEETDFFNPDKLERHLKVEVWTVEEKAHEVAEAIIESAHVGIAGDGLVSIAPVDEIFRIRTRQPATETQV